LASAGYAAAGAGFFKESEVKIQNSVGIEHRAWSKGEKIAGRRQLTAGSKERSEIRCLRSGLKLISDF